MKISFEITPSELFELLDGLSEPQEPQEVPVGMLVVGVKSKISESQGNQNKRKESNTNNQEKEVKENADKQPKTEGDGSEISNDEHPDENRGGKNYKKELRSKPVDVCLESDEKEDWKKFKSVKDAADYIGTTSNSVIKAIKQGKSIMGYKVRYTNKELDDIFKKIDEDNKKPYEPGK